jgi:hypothetical protein
MLRQELYRYLSAPPPSSATKSSNPWTLPIKYTPAEYNKTLTPAFTQIHSRLGVRAVDAEKVAWVLGHEKADLSISSNDSDAVNTEAGEEFVTDDDEDNEDETAEEQKKEDEEKEAAPKGTKRKASNTEHSKETKHRKPGNIDAFSMAGLPSTKRKALSADPEEVYKAPRRSSRRKK